ncbi:MAG: hypothetical protein KGJ89_04470 [Patescibacteria group bacterium]|nr:hypothetical protein [Patescibacteria group bacterium]MDE2015806.1 hypothetical protein [Patescibacteria group bacterium]MDE2227181.1 hypothetical protein [Patescibacteria group bacterium]
MERALVRPVSMFEFQEMFGSIYGPANEKATIQKLISILCQTVCLGIMKNARKNKKADLIEQLPNVMSRSFAIQNRLNFNAEADQHFKFPGVCSYCLSYDGCICSFRKTSGDGYTPAGKKRLAALRADKKNLPKTIREHQLSHKKLYGRRHEEYTLLHISTRLVEEVAEVSEAYDIGQTEELRFEIADVQSWVFGVCNLINLELPEHQQIYIDDLMWQYYPWQCKKCHRNVCCGECGKRVGA